MRDRINYARMRRTVRMNEFNIITGLLDALLNKLCTHETDSNNRIKLVVIMNYVSAFVQL